MGLDRFRAAIVDLDGTLVDTLGDFEAALNLTMADLGLPVVTRALVAQAVGKGSDHLIRTVLAHQLALPGVQDPDPAALALRVQALCEPAWAHYQKHYRRINGRHATVYPGVVTGLQALRSAGLTLACLTNKPLAFARDLLADKALAGYFSQVFGGDSFARKKPDPLPVRQTCLALGVASAQTLMVGDSSNDAQAGAAAGCGVVLVTYGYNHGQPIRATPALAWVDALHDIPDALAAV